MQVVWRRGLLGALGLVTALSLNAWAQLSAESTAAFSITLPPQLPIEVTYRSGSLIAPGRLTPNTDPSVLSVHGRRALIGDQLVAESDVSYAAADSHSVDHSRILDIMQCGSACKDNKAHGAHGAMVSRIE